MKWFFCWCQDSDWDDHNWKDLIRVSVESARKNTTLEPNFIYDGARSEFTDELRDKGVNVIFHRLSFTQDVIAYKPDDKGYQATARGAFLRFDIPIVADPADELVLYTDADVMFMENPNLSGYQPDFIAAAPQGDRGRRADMNSGVMLLNLKKFRAIHAELMAFTRQNMHLGLDQEILREFLGTDYLLLPDIYNWKPYWGVSQDAPIIHWHGPKPETVNKLLNGTIESTHAAWLALYERDIDAYRHYLNIHKKFLFGESRARGHSLCNVALGKTATQSSVSEWAAHASPEEDAAGALNGVIDGRQGFHTEIEDSPWWMVDLGDVFGISKIVIFNRMDIPEVAERANHLAVEIGSRQDNLVEVFRREDPRAFGGIDGHPLVFNAGFPVFGRFVRIRLFARNYLHLDQVEVYAEPVPAFIPKELL